MHQTHTSELISVIVPVYNAKSWLQKCIDSVLSQTYSNLEILLIDDGSTDGSSNLCDSYGETYSQIRVCHQTNQGLSAARNTGLDMASGNYIFFLDSDDFLEPDALESMYYTLTDTNADLVIGAYQTVNVAGEPLKREGFPYSAPVIAISEADFWQLSVHHSVAIIACSKLYSKRLWDTLCFPVGKIHEDNAVLHQIVKQCQKIVYLNQVVLNYRSTPDSIMNRPFRLANLDKAEVLTDQILYLYEKGYHDMGLYYWGVGSRLILQAKNELDLSNPKTINTIHKLYHSYKKLAKRLSQTSSIRLKSRFQLYLFRLNLNLYQRVRELFFNKAY